MEKKVYVIMYHYVRPIEKSAYPGIKGLELEDFRKQIDFLIKNFRILNINEFWDLSTGNKVVSENSVLLTFDDGYADHYRHVLPILKEYGLTGVFYIPARLLTEKKVLDVNKIQFILASQPIEQITESIFALLDACRKSGYLLKESNEELYRQYATEHPYDTREVRFVKQVLQIGLPDKIKEHIVNVLFHDFLEKRAVSEEKFFEELYLNEQQMEEMDQSGMHIGLHGYSHQWMGEMSPLQMKHEIDESICIMKKFLDENFYTINYPYGSFTGKTCEYAKKAGCKLGFSVKRGIIQSGEEIMALPRLDTNDFPPISDRYIDF